MSVHTCMYIKQDMYEGPDEYITYRKKEKRMRANDEVMANDCRDFVLI